MDNAALRLPDVHDFEPSEDPGDPCPNCISATVEDGVCWLCGTTFCEGCGKAEALTDSACCGACAPLYTVTVGNCDVYQTRSLRRAWEAQRYFEEWSPYYGASLLNRNRADLDSDGITDREQGLLESWDVYENGPCASVHLCLQRGLDG